MYVNIVQTKYYCTSTTIITNIGDIFHTLNMKCLFDYLFSNNKVFSY